MASKAVLKLNDGIGDNLMVFLVDTIAEIDDVSTTVAIGSSIICLENKKTYILSTTREWIEQ